MFQAEVETFSIIFSFGLGFIIFPHPPKGPNTEVGSAGLVRDTPQSVSDEMIKGTWLSELWSILFFFSRIFQFLDNITNPLRLIGHLVDI